MANQIRILIIFLWYSWQHWCILVVKAMSVLCLGIVIGPASALPFVTWFQTKVCHYLVKNKRDGWWEIIRARATWQWNIEKMIHDLLYDIYFSSCFWIMHCYRKLYRHSHKYLYRFIGKKKIMMRERCEHYFNYLLNLLYLNDLWSFSITDSHIYVDNL